MAWFRRTEKGIQTQTHEKKDTPQGLWYKSPTGKIIDTEQLAENFYVSPEDGYHVRIGSKEYFEIIFDDNTFKELDASLKSKDPTLILFKKFMLWTPDLIPLYFMELSEISRVTPALFLNFKGLSPIEVKMGLIPCEQARIAWVYSCLSIRK